MAEGTSYTVDDMKNGRIKEWNTFPCIVKPCCGGSSIGVSKADNREEFEKALSDCFRYENEAVVEQFIKGREFSVGILDGKALPSIEIIADGFYDYKNKYSGKTLEVCPAQISEELEQKLRSAAEKAFASLRLSVYSRFDFIIDENEDIYCLEANTLPGMTQASLIPQEAAVTGLDHAALCEFIVSKSLERF
jgi:D-alanine-D-alanine ligase